MRAMPIEDFRMRNVIPIEIPPHTVMLRGIGWDSNIYLIRDGREALVVDTGTGINWHVYTEVWESEGYTEGIERVVIFNTHEHFDHVGGNLALKRYFEEKGAEVIFATHEIAARTLERGDDYVILSHYYGRKYEPHEIEVKLKDGNKLRIGSVELRLIHTPGHTAGSACLYEPEEKLMFTGDTIFEGTVGRTDLPTGNGWELRESLEMLMEFDVYLGLPGHGWVIKNWSENLREILGWL
ncbi:MBL fold metallo-hydrolase [Thermococcus sp. CX2]|nr:MBL fold metallo-hydrolase [Thermococcus sp. CX2]